MALGKIEKGVWDDSQISGLSDGMSGGIGVKHAGQSDESGLGCVKRKRSVGHPRV